MTDDRFPFRAHCFCRGRLVFQDFPWRHWDSLKWAVRRQVRTRRRGIQLYVFDKDCSGPFVTFRTNPWRTIDSHIIDLANVLPEHRAMVLLLNPGSASAQLS